MKLKRILAVAMATTMVLGMSMTALAADGDATGDGGANGTGTSEGHVEQKHLNVVLPTAAETTFAYTMDPERLIQTTSGGKYEEETTFPEAAGDTGVYFLTGEKTYSNTSSDLEIINKSSADVKVDVKVKTEATAAGTDITLATAALDGSETTPKLYLAAQVGEGAGKSTQILSATEAPVSRILAGNAGNYEIVVTTDSDGNKGYAYQQKKTGLTAWKSLKFNITGAVTNKEITAETTAPKIVVTWAFAEKASDDTTTVDTGVSDYVDIPGPSIAQTSITIPESGAVSVPVSLGEGTKAATGITSVYYLSQSGAKKDIDATGYALDTAEDGSVSFRLKTVTVDAFRSGNSDSRVYSIEFNDTAKTVVSITLNK
ncbi:hypothetical protein [Pseudobutyrivibrio xylanivorans]|uniref:Uncharacterized protein n=1 Tax=Pseudobutyrivibrio xylanivorans TaxID=185007 RepID=A0A1G5RQE0_PSEXY|nr:hypothetical protein [Pseudobutyrivibrio xylanivorans]SCZ76070.1 hypothetical protein SAMN02910350_00063 [Pseudobutyrivibrio xylanivorans]